MREILDRLIDEFHERPLPDLLPRDGEMPHVRGKATVVVGMRRAGKTWFCYQHMRDLLGEGLPIEQLLYLNFEDERLLPFSVQDFQSILDVYYRKYPDLHGRRCHLFLDEVQRISGWENFVRRVLDAGELAVYVTGSSSKLLSSEIATSLRGRALTVELFPFSFQEFLRFHRDFPRASRRFGQKTRALLQNRLRNYVRVGGFPEVQDLHDDPRRQVLRGYVDVVILRDVVERHRVSNVSALRALMRHIMSAPSTRFSINKFYNDLRSQGISSTKNTLYDFMDYLEDAFLCYRVPIHSRSERVRRVNPSKIYVIDSGLLESTSFQSTQDHGASLENLVFMQLRRTGHRPEYYLTADGSEVDFVVPARSRREWRLVQVCWNLEDSSTRQREVDALEIAMRDLRVQRATIVTGMQEGSIDDRIEIVPAWKWLVRSAH